MHTRQAGRRAGAAEPGQTREMQHTAEPFSWNRHLKGNAAPLTFRPRVYNGAGRAAAGVWGESASLDLLSWDRQSAFKNPLRL